MKNMNEFSFYEKLKEIILYKYQSLKNNYLSEFFNADKYFELALATSYLVLSEESIITDNKITLRMDKDKLDYLFTKEFCDFPPVIYKSRNKRDSKKNLQNIRNGLLHGLFMIDFENQKFKIINQEKNFICDVPFEWIKSYMNYHILEDKTTRRVQMKEIFITKDIFKNLKHLDDLQSVSDYINKLYIYEIDIRSENNINKQEVKRFVKEYISNNLITLPNNQRKSNIYKQKFQMLRHDLIQAIKEKYEGTQVNIRIIKDIDIAKELNDMYNTEENDIYKIKDPIEQCNIIIDRLRKFYEKSTDDLIKSFEDINTTLQIYNNYIKNNPAYEANKSIINYILNTNANEEEILNFIHNIRKQNPDSKNSYDNFIIGGEKMPLSKKDRRAINNYYKKHENIQLGDNYTIELGKIKGVYKVYQRLLRNVERKEFISDEDVELYNSEIIKSTIKIRDVINKQKENIDLAIIYTLGISTFAMNKEKALDESNYENINTKRIQAYSEEAYSEYKNRREWLERSKEQLIRFIKSEPNKKRRETLKSNLREIESKLSTILKEKIIEFRGRNLAICTKKQTSTLIRNCFSHLLSSKISYSCYDKGEMELITNNGYIKCDVFSLIDFITQDGFSNIMKEKYKPERGKQYIKKKNTSNSNNNKKDTE